MYRATIDMNVIRASLDRERAGHADASRLLDAAARGDVELAIPPQGALADLHGQYDGDLARDIETLLAKPGVVELPQVARLSDISSREPVPWPLRRGLRRGVERRRGRLEDTPGCVSRR